MRHVIEQIGNVRRGMRLAREEVCDASGWHCLDRIQENHIDKRSKAILQGARHFSLSVEYVCS